MVTAPTCARPGCAEPVGRCYRKTTGVAALLCKRHRHSLVAARQYQARRAAGWVPVGEGRSTRVYSTELRGMVLAAPRAGVCWLLSLGQRVMAAGTRCASWVEAERACDAAAGRGARR